MIRGDVVEVREDAEGYQHGTVTGNAKKRAFFRQKRDTRPGAGDEYMEGEAERIEYNTSNEVAELFHRAWVKSGEDEVKGDYIWYDGISEKYLVTAGETRGVKAPPARVRAIIQPKNKGSEPTPATKGNPLELRGAAGLSTPPSRE